MRVDTDVLIWHLRGFPEATRQLDSLSKLNISTMTWMELLQGFRNRTEMIAVQSSLKLRKAERLPVTRDISERAVALMEALALSRGLRLGDAVIGATAMEHGLTVLTGNTRHFNPIDGLRVERFELGG